MYKETRNMWNKKLSSKKSWDEFKKFFMEEYHNPHKLKLVNATQAGFHGANITIKIKYKIYNSLDNLETAPTS